MEDKLMRGIVIAMVLTAIIVAHILAAGAVPAVMSVAGALIAWVTRSPLAEPKPHDKDGGQ